MDKSKLIDGFIIQEIHFPDVVLNSWSDVVSYVSGWEGTPSISIESFSSASKLDFLGNEFQPLGSGFKLYVLGALADKIGEGGLHWSDEFPIIPDWKSLPSGVMQGWKNGEMVSLKTYAEYMISISDNTATDHLINILGREAVEEQLLVMGNRFSTFNTPFLTTAEMFKIKWGASSSVIYDYVTGDSVARLNILNQSIIPMPLSKVGTNGISMEQPAFIRDIEWFGSTNDLCRALESLKELNSSEVRGALSKNVPFLEVGPNSHWSFGGYKCGSEPGVLTMTYLLQNKNSDWGCVSVAWNNEKKNVNQWVFFDFVAKLLRLSEKIL